MNKQSASPNTDLTFRRYEDGDTAWDDWQEKVFKGDHSHKCPTYVHRTPPCQGSCPSGHDIRGWLAIARGQDKPADDRPWQEYAFERMVSANPFPAVMGRVCPAPCEDGCNRNEVDDFVGINAVEQYVGDYAVEHKLKLPLPEVEQTGKKVAVIGSGPGGLSAAYQLRLKGHSVTVFEAQDELGGMMRYGIPPYRIPRDVLDAEIQRVLDTGVETKIGVKVGKDLSLEQLDNDFDAVFWAIGAQKGRPVPIPGFDAPNCISGVAFLDAFNKGTLQFTDKKIIVIGGGDTSIDVASVARRIGHIKTRNEKDRTEHVVWGQTAHDTVSSAAREGADVTLTSLFPVEGMTAAEREREDAISEGIDIKGSVMPLEVILDAEGRAKGLKMAECEMDGMVPNQIDGTEFNLFADLIVSAIGQGGDMEGLEGLDNGKSFIAADPMYQVKGRKGHFAGGDILRPHLLTTAIGHGSIASETIDQYLMQGEARPRPKVDKHHFSLLDELRQRHLEPEHFEPAPTWGTSDAKFAVHNYEDRAFAEVVTHEELFRGHFTYDARGKREEMKISPDNVLGNYEERTTGLSEEQVKHEGERCMSCGMCFECDNCLIFCPQDAVFRVKKDQKAVGRYVDTDYARCVGCHICKDVCPTGYIQMGLGE